MAQSGLQTLAHLITSRTGQSRPFAQGVVFRVDQVSAMLEDRAGNMWVGVDDGLYIFKSGRFLRLPEPNHQPLGMVVGMTEDIEGDIWAECLSNPRKLVRIRDFRVSEEFPASQIPPGHSLAADPHGGIWIATKKGDIGLFRNGVLETKVPLNPGGDPPNRQIMSTADGSVIAGSENGLSNGGRVKCSG